MEYTKSTTKVSEQVVAKMLEAGYGSEWTHPRTGKVRVYLNTSDMAKVIGLEVSYHLSGNANGCSYVGLDGERTDVANRRAWSKYYSKVYIEDGLVYSNWNPYGVDIAELVAVRAMEDFGGIDPDGGEAEEKWMVTADSDRFSEFYFAAKDDAMAKSDEMREKYPERGYRVARVSTGKTTGRTREIA